MDREKEIWVRARPICMREDAIRILDCVDLHDGFARVKCRDCHHEYLLAFPESYITPRRNQTVKYWVHPPKGGIGEQGGRSEVF